MASKNREQPLKNLKSPDTIKIHLKTVTPLYTGGIGQCGDQVHPSGLLGSIRNFSCLLASAIGKSDSDFEHSVWGTPGEVESKQRHAKQVALRWDFSKLKTLELPYSINIKDTISDQKVKKNHKGWFFNCAQTGKFTLNLTRRGISDVNWHILLLALRIQILHATLGAKDQFGLGVVDFVEGMPEVEPLQNIQQPLTDAIPNLNHAFFAELSFPCPCPELWEDRLTSGLQWRAHLRNSFRESGETDLRHYLFGFCQIPKQQNIKEWGSAINISAVYPFNKDKSAIRIWGVLPHTSNNLMARKIIQQREQILKRLADALKSGPQTPCAHNTLTWEMGTFTETQINTLAGIQ